MDIFALFLSIILVMVFATFFTYWVIRGAEKFNAEFKKERKSRKKKGKGLKIII